MKRTLYLLFFCFSSVIPAVAQQKDTTANFSLQQAIYYALNHQISIKNAKVDEEIAANTVKKTIGIGLPQVNGTVNFQDAIKKQVIVFGDQSFAVGTTYTSGIGLEATQLVFDGSYLIGLKASKTYKELSVKNTNRSRIETAVGVTKAYYAVLVSNEKLTLIDANLERLRKSLSDTEAMLKNGFVEKIDVDRLNVLNNNLLTEKENVLRLLTLNVNLLKFQMGMTISSNLTLTDKISDVNVGSTPVLAGETVYNKRIEYSLLQTQKKLNELDLKRYKSQFLPSVAAFGNYFVNFQDDRFSNLYGSNFPTSIIGLKVNIPIFSGFQKKYQVENAKLEVLKADNNLINLQNSIDLEVSQAQTTYLNGQKSLENQKRNMELAKEVLRVTKVKYEQGVGSSLEVTTAETSLKEAENNYITALYDMLINKVNLDKALGNINY